MEFFRKLFGIKNKKEKAQLEKEFNELISSLKSKVSGLVKPAVHVIKVDSKTNSKFGGKPIVDRIDFEWPYIGDRPLTFLLQFDLTELSTHLQYDWLNNSGSVLIFYDLKEMPWGYDPKDRGKWKVIFQANPKVEVEFPRKLDKNLILKERHFDFKKVNLLPSFEDKCITSLNLTDEETDLYIELNEHYEEYAPYRESPAHQIGGFASPVQGDDMQFEAKQASNGVYMGDGNGFKNATEADFQLAKDEWQLLFQFDSDDYLDVMWGDAGILYFWVENSKSKHNDFSNVWAVLQCS